jgi:hypothetical protein
MGDAQETKGQRDDTADAPETGAEEAEPNNTHHDTK